MDPTVGSTLIRNSQDINSLIQEVGEVRRAVIELCGIATRLALAIDGKMTPVQLDELRREAGSLMAKVARVSQAPE